MLYRRPTTSGNQYTFKNLNELYGDHHQVIQLVSLPEKLLKEHSVTVGRRGVRGDVKTVCEIERILKYVHIPLSDLALNELNKII